MLKQPIAGQTLLISLRSWRYIICVSLLAYMITGVLLYGQVTLYAAGLSLLFGLVTLFYCWRLWLDEGYFSLLYQKGSDSDAFDAAINALWSKSLPPRTLDQRWIGAAKLIKRAWLFVVLQWLATILASMLSQGS